MILVSACLIGLNTKYNGGNNINKVFVDLIKHGNAIPFCPEQAGGLPTPRPAAEIIGGDGCDVLDGKARVINREGVDVTEAFIKGAQETLKLAKLVYAKEVIFKTKSPSCGSSVIYDGSFTGKLKDGMGVTAAMLLRNGIRVIGSDDLLSEKF